MTAVKHILCPTDFSESSRHALEQATAIARWYGARLTVLHVAPSTRDALPGENDEGDVIEGLERRRKMAFDEARAAKDAGVDVDVRVEAGLPWNHIVERADDLGADLLVMGTHGASGLQHLMLGSVAEKVLRTARCPVLTVPLRATAAVALPFKHVLCPVDFSPASVMALQVACAIAQEGRAALTLVHVLDWPSNTKLLRKDAHRRLESLVPSSVNWCTPEIEVIHGNPHREVLHLASDARADLIVIGFHGRNVLDRTLFGSTTTEVVRHATCPVLTVRDETGWAPAVMIPQVANAGAELRRRL